MDKFSIVSTRVHKRPVLPEEMDAPGIRKFLDSIWPSAVTWECSSVADARSLAHMVYDGCGKYRIDKRRVVAWVELSEEEQQKLGLQRSLEQAALKPQDAWTPFVAAWLARWPNLKSVTTSDVLEQVPEIAAEVKGRATHSIKIRVAKILQNMGWKRGRKGELRTSVWWNPDI